MQYKAIAVEQQTVKEFVCCRMYELMERETRNKEALNMELQQLTQQLVRAESEMERVRMDKEQLSRNKRLSHRQHTHPHCHVRPSSPLGRLSPYGCSLWVHE